MVTTGDVSDPCHASSCVVPDADIGSVISVSVQTPNSLADVPATVDTNQQCLSARVTLRAVENVTFAQQRQRVPPSIFNVSVLALLAVAVVCFVMFGVFFAVGTAISRRWQNSLRGTRRIPRLRQLLTSGAIPRWARSVFNVVMHVRTESQLQSVATGFAVTFVIFVCCAGAMLVLFETTKSVDTTFALVLRSYPTAVCDGQWVRRLPQIVALSGADNLCKTMRVAGASRGPMVTKVACKLLPNGTYAAEAAFAPSLAECEDASTVILPTGTCLPVKNFTTSAFPIYDDYVTLECVEESLTSTLFSQVSAVTPTVNASDRVPASAPHHALALNRLTHDPVTNAKPCVAPSGVLTTTSHHSTRVTSVRDADHFVGLRDGARLLTQPFPVIFSDDEPAVSNRTTAVESQYRRTLDSLPPPKNITEIAGAGERADRPGARSLPVAPYRDKDYPTGFIFNDFGTVNARKGEASAVGAHRYFGIAETDYDVGYWWGPPEFEDGLGFSISMWLRVDRTTEGFAFIVCDHFENRASGDSPVVNKLIGIARDGEASVQRWFDKSFRVYASLFVQGSDRSMAFMYADPYSADIHAANASGIVASVVDSLRSEEERARIADVQGVQTLRWDFDVIGQRHVFNGAWHHIAIVMENTNKRPAARLIIDGYTSLAVGWNKCMGRRPTPVQPRNTTFATDDVDRAAVASVDEGVMYVGHFNGGVAHLQFEAEPITTDDIARNGTRAIRIRSAVRKVSMQTVGWTAIFGIAVLLLLSTQRVKAVRAKQLKAEADEQERLQDLWERKRRNLFSGGYTPVPFDAVVEWLAVSPTVLTSIIEYCAEQPKEVRADGRSTAVTAVRVLWIATHPEVMEGRESLEDIRAVYPTADEWNAFVMARCGEDGELVQRRAAQGGEGKVKAKAKAKAKAKGKAKAKAKGKAPAAGGATSGMGAVFQSILATFQAMAIYSASWQLPKVYSGSFLPVFKIASFQAPPSVSTPALITPLVLFCIGAVTLVALSFVLVLDQRGFYALALRFMTRRNHKDSLVPFTTQLYKKMLAIMDEGERRGKTLYRYAVNVFGRSLRGKLHEFSLGTVPTIELDDGNGLVVQCTHCEGRVFDMDKGEERDAEETDVMLHFKSNVATDDGKDTALLRPMVPVCPEHPHARLSMVEQTRIVPFDNRRSCCAVFLGERCGKRTGPMFLCECDVDDHGDDAKKKEEKTGSKDATEPRSEANAEVKRLPGVTLESAPTQLPEAAALSDDGSDAIGDAPTGDAVTLLPARCNYALCEEHFSAAPAVRIQILIVGAIRSALAGGVGWLIAQIIVSVGLALYTPVMQNAFMILTCHPQYQCEFPKCWREVTPIFGATAYCAALSILILGVGFPMALVKLLSDRERALDDVFNHSAYGGRFLNDDELFYTPEEAVDAAERAAARRLVRRLTRKEAPFDRAEADAAAARDAASPHQDSMSLTTVGSPSPALSIESPGLLPSPSPPGSPSAARGKLTEEELAELHPVSAHVWRHSSLVNRAFVPSTQWTRRQQRQRPKELRVDEGAWSEFLQVDKSLLFVMYEVLQKERIVFAPIIMVLKFGAVLPAVLLSPNSFGQLVGILVGTSAYAVFAEFTSPYNNVWISLIEEAGLCHQFGMIFLQAYLFSLKNDEEVLDRLGIGMIVITAVYIAAVAIMLINLLVAPALRGVMDSVVKIKSFARFGLNNFEEIPVYFKPTKGYITRQERTADDESDASSVASVSDSDQDEAEDVQRTRRAREEEAKRQAEEERRTREAAAALSKQIAEERATMIKREIERMNMSTAEELGLVRPQPAPTFITHRRRRRDAAPSATAPAAQSSHARSQPPAPLPVTDETQRRRRFRLPDPQRRGPVVQPASRHSLSVVDESLYAGTMPNDDTAEATLRRQEQRRRPY